MNLAVIGSGGREHAICYKLKQSSKIKKLVCIPGNAGTQKIAENIKEDILNFEALYKIIKKKCIDIVIVGPEQPLVEGLVDYLNEKGYKVVCIDKHKTFGKLECWNTVPNGVIDKTSCSIEEAINLLNYADFHIGMSSGLSWLSWGVGIPVLLVSPKPYSQCCCSQQQSCNYHILHQH